MSSTAASTDLIDFLGVDAPALSAPAEPSDVLFADSLIDTELPEFEQKLQQQQQKSEHAVLNNGPEGRPVDVEDVLIRIDSDEFERDSLDGDAEFLDICQGLDNGNEGETTLPVDNFEALLVLKNLDDILNATLEESADGGDDVVNGNDDLEEEEEEEGDEEEEEEEEEENTQQVIEECLEDLDNYLQGFEGSDSDGSRGDEEDCSMEEQANETSEARETQPEFDEEVERSKLRKIEENYRKFVAVSGIVNRAYVETENNADVTHARRPSSACAVVDRKRPFRAHTVTDGTRPKRSCLIRRRQSLTDDPAHRRTSGTLLEPGTVIVSCSSTTTTTTTSATTAVPERRWLRSSMRRLEQVTLPNVETVFVETTVVPPEEAARPVSAPSRLPPVEPPIPDRSRSRALANGRTTRSRSTSSRRPTSASSSDASSVDSAVERAAQPAPPTQRRSGWFRGLMRLMTSCPPASRCSSSSRNA